MKKKKFLKIPKFKNEDSERDFWATADSSLYFDFSKMRHVSFPNLKMTDPEKLKKLQDDVKKKTSLDKVFASIKPLDKKMSFKKVRKIALEDKIAKFKRSK